MTKSQIVFILAGLLILGFGMPGVSLAVTGCSNANLLGTYNAQISSAALTGVLNALNPQASGGSTGSTGNNGNNGGLPSGGNNGGLFGGNTGFGNDPGMGGSTGGSNNSASGATSQRTINPGGFGNNPLSLGGATPGVGRYYLDGAGNIVGRGTGPATQAIIGAYNVNTDCTGTMSLQTGETFYTIINTDGSDVLFVQSNAGQGGAVGELTRGTAACLSGGVVQTFGFSFFGAQAIPSGSGSAAAANSPGSFGPTSGVGSITLDGQGGFTLKQWSYSNAGFKQMTSMGTYSINADCSLHLSFAPASGNGGSTGSVGSPLSLTGLLISGPNGMVNGLIVEQADQNSLGMGTLISQ